MSFTFDDSIKERVRGASDIVNIISQYVPLRRSGRNLVGLCPWHSDSRPSLQVNPDRQTYKCWVCDIGGDVFSFTMKVENIDFKEALELLAEKAGIVIPKPKRKKIAVPDDANNNDVKEPPKEISKQDLLRAADWIAGVYHSALLESEEAEPVRKYLQERNISDEDIETFQLGYAPLNIGLVADKLKHSAQRMQVLEILGNLVRKDNTASQKYYDRFHGRLMFPILDAQGRAVGFGGRLIPGIELNSQAKYINSPETFLFSKHQLLYGLHQAKQKIKETKSVLIMEGYTDVITAHRFGFSNAVAVLGTALGAAHVQILKRYADKMYLVLDGDDAGKKRAAQVLEHFVSEGADMSVVTLPAGLDPADYLKQYGAEAFAELLQKHAVDVFEHAIRTAVQGIDLQRDIVGATNALNTVLMLLAKAPAAKNKLNDPIALRVEKMIQNLALRFNTKEQIVRSRLKELRIANERQGTRNELPNQYESESNISASESIFTHWDNNDLMPDDVETEMLELLLSDPTVVYEFWKAIPVDCCRSPLTQIIYQKASDIVEHDKLATFARLLTAFDDPQMKKYLDDLAETAAEKIKNKIIGINGSKTSEGYRDKEVDAINESMQLPLKLPSELKMELIGEVIEAYRRREEEHSQMTAMSLVQQGVLSEEEEKIKLRQMYEALRKSQEEIKTPYS